MTTFQASQPLHVVPGPARDEEIFTGPNEQPSSSEFTPAHYLRQIENHSESSARSSLYHGEHFRSLAEFLMRKFQNPLSSDATDRFATYYRLQNDQRSPSPAKLSLPGYPISNGDHLLPSETAMIFLEGYPSARGLIDLGATCNIDPEFYQRHISFLNPRGSKHGSFLPPVLPSFQSSILQMSVTTIGRHVTPQHRSVDEKRRHSAGKMDEYLLGLRNGWWCKGRNWKPSDSVIRAFAVHDENEFSIQQMITIGVTRIAGGDDCWKVVVWLDAGRGLKSSPGGPWSSPVNDILLVPVSLHKPGIVLRDHRYPDYRFKAIDSNELVQSLSLLPVAFGRSLHPEVMRHDPFYSLSEIFDFVAASEMQFLTAIENQLDRRSESFQITIAGPSLDLHADLSYFRNLLEDHVNNIEKTNGFIRNRHTLRWPRSDSDKAQVAALRIELDYEALLTRARHLRDRCERDMGVVLSKSQLCHAKQAMSETKQILKLTVLTAILLPVIATGTVFGMNFVTFVSASQGVWVWILTTIPLMIVSLVAIAGDGNIMGKMKK